MPKPLKDTRRSLPRLKHHLTSGRDLDSRDEEVEILLEAGVVRDWSQGRKLVRTRKRSAEDLFWELTRKRKKPWGKRFRRWLIRMGGGYLYDPHKKEMEELDGYEGWPHRDW